MSDLTLTLSYKERSDLLDILRLTRSHLKDVFPGFLEDVSDTLEAVSLRVSRLQCQPGGCPDCYGNEPDVENGD